MLIINFLSECQSRAKWRMSCISSTYCTSIIYHCLPWLFFKTFRCFLLLDIQGLYIGLPGFPDSLYYLDYFYIMSTCPSFRKPRSERTVSDVPASLPAGLPRWRPSRSGCCTTKSRSAGVRWNCLSGSVCR